MKEHVFSDRSHSDLANFLITLSFIELEISGVASIYDDALRVFIHSAPVMQRA